MQQVVVFWLAQKLGGDRPTVLRVIVEFTAVLTDLNLRANNIGNDGAIAIAGALSSGMAMLTTIECVFRAQKREPRLEICTYTSPTLARTC